MRGKIICCGCGSLFNVRTWMADGVIGASVNSGRRHYACKSCREAGFHLVQHAAGIFSTCAEAGADRKIEYQVQPTTDGNFGVFIVGVLVAERPTREDAIAAALIMKSKGPDYAI